MGQGKWYCYEIFDTLKYFTEEHWFEYHAQVYRMSVPGRRSGAATIRDNITGKIMDIYWLKIPTFPDKFRKEYHYIVLINAGEYWVRAAPYYRNIAESFLIKYVFHNKFNVVPDMNNLTIFVFGKQHGVNRRLRTIKGNKVKEYANSTKYNVIFISTRGRKYRQTNCFALRTVFLILVRFFSARIKTMARKCGKETRIALELLCNLVDLFKRKMIENQKIFIEVIKRKLLKKRGKKERYDINTNIRRFLRSLNRLLKKIKIDEASLGILMTINAPKDLIKNIHT